MIRARGNAALSTGVSPHAASAHYLAPHTDGPAAAPSLSELARRAVGKHNLVDLVTSLKRSMLIEALTRSSGNIAVASELLGISRQAVQQMIQRADLQAWVRSLRRAGRERG